MCSASTASCAGKTYLFPSCLKFSFKCSPQPRQSSSLTARKPTTLYNLNKYDIINTIGYYTIGGPMHNMGLWASLSVHEVGETTSTDSRVYTPTPSTQTDPLRSRYTRPFQNPGLNCLSDRTNFESNSSEPLDSHMQITYKILNALLWLITTMCVHGNSWSSVFNAFDDEDVWHFSIVLEPNYACIKHTYISIVR